MKEEIYNLIDKYKDFIDTRKLIYDDFIKGKKFDLALLCDNDIKSFQMFIADLIKLSNIEE